MARKIYNVCRGRDYEASGKQKTQWQRVGVLVIDGEKISLRLDAIPAGEWDGWLKVFPKDDGRPGERQAAGGGSDFEDDIPF